MARREHGAAAEALSEIETAADRLSEWLQEHFRWVLAAVVGVLVLAGLGSWIAASRESAEQEASLALAEVREEYLSAMGASPGAVEVPELANPEAAAEIRAEYDARFGEIASRYPGTVAAVLAGMESARLASADGREDDARALLERTLADAPAGAPVRGVLLQQLAQRLENAERWAEAADRHEQAANLERYPLRGWALADAARCRAAAGETEAALALYERLERELPELTLPEHQQAERAALRAERAVQSG